MAAESETTHMQGQHNVIYYISSSKNLNQVLHLLNKNPAHVWIGMAKDHGTPIRVVL